MEIEKFIFMNLVILFASIVQSTVGFAFALTSLPLLLFLGFSLPETVMLCTVASTVQRCIAVYHMRRFVDWRQIAPLVLIASFTIPLGLFIMYKLTFLDRKQVKQVIGACILLALIIRWTARIKPRENINPWWGYSAAATSGVLTGMAGIGGPPMVLWLLAHRWPNEKMRVMLLAYSLPLSPVFLTLLTLTFGVAVLKTALWAILAIPTALLGTWLGLKLGKRIPRNILRVIVQIVLVMIALSAIIKPMFEN